ncbi:ATP-binding cassette sub- E member 1 [Bonamia ostreae]|uniref:ATP-binding cassette sub- E member 1 n=1 Tax=Bonamia ostreae TaxID=126728 RepID=A0ABV2ASG7_9EUKA
MERTQGNFKLKIKGGAFQNSEIIVMLGRNGTGKTTFIKLLAKEIKPDDEIVEIPDLCVSYKPQTIQSDFVGSVRSLLHKKIRGVYTTSTFVTDVIRPLKIYDIIDRDVATLSGGELQRLSITLCVGKKADLYLFDEPSAYLDSEQRMVASKVIKKFILGNKKTAFVVEHDFIMATYLADKIIVYEGQPAKKCIANPAETLENGMNRFLKALRITFRRDPTNFRPRINKMGSQKDQEQKNSGDYFASKA